jgi:hypothetical protein
MCDATFPHPVTHPLAHRVLCADTGDVILEYKISKIQESAPGLDSHRESFVLIPSHIP